MVSALMSLYLLEDELRHTHISKCLFEQKSIRIGQRQIRSARSAPPTEARGKTSKTSLQKQRQKIM